MVKRIISFFLVLVMGLSVFSLSVFASSVVTADGLGGHEVNFNLNLGAARAHQTVVLEITETDGTVITLGSFTANAAGIVTGYFRPGALDVSHIVVNVYAPGEAQPLPNIPGAGVNIPVPPAEVTISFNANSGTGLMPDVTIPGGSSFTIPANAFTRPRFNFTGWNTAADGSGTPFAAGAVIPNVTANMTLFAQWVIIPVYASVVFELNGGTLLSGQLVQQVLIGGAAAAPEVSRAGFNFAGWSSSPPNMQLNNITGDVLFTAQWTPIGGDPPFIPTPPNVGIPPGTGPGPGITPGERPTVDPGDPPPPDDRPGDWPLLEQRRPWEIPPLVMFPASSLFDDVVVGAWYYDFVTIVASNFLMHGTAYRIFEPQTTMSRAMFAQVLANLAGAELRNVAAATPAFTDVQHDDWFFAAVQWGYNEGLISGVGGGRFDPLAPVTREQMASLLNRFVVHYDVQLPTTGATPAFTDQASISGWAANDVRAIQAAGIIGGYPDGSFQPQGNATRAEVATIFAGFLTLVQQGR